MWKTRGTKQAVTVMHDRNGAGIVLDARLGNDVKRRERAARNGKARGGVPSRARPWKIRDDPWL